MTVWRWIETGPTDGASHMAVDQALLENVSESQLPTMRVYSWKPACISLGIHQSSEHIDLDRCRKDGLSVVRRPTGGRAVLHDDEVTYSVVFPEGTPIFLRSLSEIYDLINRGLLRGIKQLGVPAELEKRSLNIRNHYKSKLSTSCFSAAAKFEIVVQGKKMVGSAQRRTASGVLQHGSILLGQGQFALPDYFKGISVKEKSELIRILRDRQISIKEVLERDVSFEEAVLAVKQGMAEFLRVRFDIGGLTKTEMTRIGELRERFSVSV